MKISGEMPRNGRKRAAVKRTEFAVLATGTKQGPGQVKGYLDKPKTQSTCFG